MIIAVSVTIVTVGRGQDAFALFSEPASVVPYSSSLPEVTSSVMKREVPLTHPAP